MNESLKSMAAGALAQPLVKSFRWSWLLYGAAAYVGLRYLNKNGILKNQTRAALNLIDQGIETVKEKSGFSKSEENVVTH